MLSIVRLTRLEAREALGRGGIWVGVERFHAPGDHGQGHHKIGVGDLGVGCIAVHVDCRLAGLAALSLLRISLGSRAQSNGSGQAVESPILSLDPRTKSYQADHTIKVMGGEGRLLRAVLRRLPLDSGTRFAANG